MDIEEFLKPENVIIHFAATSKKQALEALSAHLSKYVRVDHHDILAALHDRERLGSTGVGSGVALPHARLPALEKITGLFAHIEKPIMFDSVDDAPVDLIFMLLMPEAAGAENLKALAKVSKALRQETIRDKLRSVENTDSILKLFSSTSAP